MADPFVLGSSAFYEDMSYASQTCSGSEEGPMDANMTFVDPNLHSSSAYAYTYVWEDPVQQSLKQFALKMNPKAAFPFSQPTRQASDRIQIRSSIGIDPVPPPSHARLPSPVSTVEPPPTVNARSPPAETESYPDNFPRTPPDTVLLSPFQAPLPVEPYYAVQFTSMGPSGYVNPFDVNPSQQSEYSGSDSGNNDFDFSRWRPSLDSHGSHCDTESGQSTAVPDFLPERMSSPEQMPPVAEDEINASTQYPLPPKDEGDMDSDNGCKVPVKRQNYDDADGDYQPHKKRKTFTRTPRRRAAKTDVPASAPSSRRTPRSRAGNFAHPPRALPALSCSVTKTTLTCRECGQSTFRYQSELDAHIKMNHQHHPFNCVFDFAGCTKTFPNKNEWKRHVNTQHLLLHYWKCMEGDCARTHANNKPSTSPGNTNSSSSNNLFNRKDLFTQHYRRMHAHPSIRDHLPASTTTKRKAPPPSSSSSSRATNKLTPELQTRILEWEARLQHRQEAFKRDRCKLPLLMRCPVRGCEQAAFRGEEAWNQRMEHIAKHMERAAEGREGRVVFGGEGDPTLVGWASSKGVGIISRAAGKRSEDGGGGTGREGEGGWVLNGEAGNGMMIKEEEEEEEVEEMIEVSSGVGNGDEEEDAEGEEDE
ncbi:zinc finger protein ZIC 5 [Achaetomium macrosporum]|uniref:Zinc finger protein ZIC 5 n=1 Tax=Achaetomium macrosporum TaxID=79813 RepID=A0AAN7CFW9_9PEZI|nr:zinc finger protein ZIC 5 [Achaetomium macrosporum]